MLCVYSLSDAASQMVYRAVVVTRLLYAASASWGFTTAADRQCIEICLCHSVQAGYNCSYELTAAQLVEDSDQLFCRVQYNNFHVLQSLLPSCHTYSYALHDRRHNFSLTYLTLLLIVVVLSENFIRIVTDLLSHIL